MNAQAKESSSPPSIRHERLLDGAVWRLVLDAPKGNVLDAAMTRALTEAFVAAREEPDLKAILIGAAGKHFSFGASVEEHRPAQVAEMLETFHGLFRTIGACHLPVLVAVRGACLGGGLELAAFCHRVIASRDAKLGQPEIALGVFAPVGSAILEDRVGRGAADDLLLTGRTVGADEAKAMGLVDELAEDPDAACLAWVQEHLLPRSASSLRCATRAARLDFMRRFECRIDVLERLYLEELMTTEDAVEGITSFLEKRPPQWSNR